MSKRHIVPKLANSDAEWNTITGAKDSPFIRSLPDWDVAVADGRIKSSPLSKLGPEAMKRFRNRLRFVEISLNGIPKKRCCIGWFYGDLKKTRGYTLEDLLQVAALFGVGPKRFARTSDKFGDICDGDVCCRTRISYNCPDGKPDCGC